MGKRAGTFRKSSKAKGYIKKDRSNGNDGNESQFERKKRIQQEDFDMEDELIRQEDEDFDEDQVEEEEEEEDDQDQFQEEAVLGLKDDDVDEEEEEEYDDDDDNQEENWGRKARAYYKTGGEDSDEDIETAMEEQELEARRLQKAQAKSMTLDDFDADIILKSSSSKKSSKKLKKDLILSKNVNTNEEDEAILQAPELPLLLKELSLKRNEIEVELLPAIEKAKAICSSKGLPLKKTFITDFLYTKLHALLAYCTYITFYLAMKSSEDRAESKSHPVIEKISQFREYLDSLQDTSKSLYISLEEYDVDHKNELEENDDDDDDENDEEEEEEEEEENDNEDEEEIDDDDDDDEEEEEDDDEDEDNDNKLENEENFTKLLDDQDSDDDDDDSDDNVVLNKEMLKYRPGKRGLSQIVNQIEQTRKSKKNETSTADMVILPKDPFEKKDLPKPKTLSFPEVENENDQEEEEEYDEFYEKAKRESKEKKMLKAKQYAFPQRMVPDPVPLVKKGSSRQATYTILKNRGLTPHKKKEDANPRVRMRGKYEKKLKARKGQVREMRKPEENYGGEATGIRTNLVRSRIAGSKR